MSSRAAALPFLSLTLACAGRDPSVAAVVPPQTRHAPPSTPALDPRDELARLFAVHDHTAPGPARDALADRIDGLAGQRYATWSRLYWHRDLDGAIAEARATGKPILSLRMLGRLDRDLSCANSRFFRVALYANREVSRYLADHFVLHWSSERPVPVARIDFGDGRVLERTIAGNSAHYVLDSTGRPVDVIPGLYSPALFVDALARAYPIAARAGGLAAPSRAALIADFHRREAARAAERFSQLGAVELAPGERTASLAEAEGRAMSKAIVEMPVVRSLQLGSQLTLEQARAWGRATDLWDQVGAALAARVAPSRLDDRSRALFAALEPADWARAGQPLPAAGMGALVAAFEASMTRDAAYNELVLHQQIHARMAGAPALALAELNRWVYASLFLTPAEDPWLGMATPDTFSGLPRDGLTAGR
ncbi:MAG TPA: hypothetical protein VK698_34440 [Kofleriaceae bacterium]|nr:hypothetical protein [Kofleriaceae bacterium]